jgi:hypothetical protein
MERIFEAAKENGYDVVISPHYFYPTDDGWKMNGPLKADEFRTRTFARSGPLALEGELQTFEPGEDHETVEQNRPRYRRNLGHRTRSREIVSGGRCDGHHHRARSCPVAIRRNDAKAQGGSSLYV